MTSIQMPVRTHSSPLQDLGDPCAANRGPGSSLNCRTGSWAHPCCASCCRPAGTCPCPSDIRPIPSQMVPSDFLYTHPSRTAFTVLGGGHLHTCWHTSDLVLKPLPSCDRDQHTPHPPLEGALRPPNLQACRSTGLSVYPICQDGWPCASNNSTRRLAEPCWATLAGGRVSGPIQWATASAECCASSVGHAAGTGG